MVDDDEIPDFGSDDTPVVVPVVPSLPAHTDCKGRVYEVGLQVRNIHNLTVAVVTDVSDPRGIWIVYDNDEQTMRIDGRHGEILDAPKRAVVPKPAEPVELPTDPVVSDDDRTLQADLEAARDEIQQTADEWSAVDGDGLDEETFHGADEFDYGGMLASSGLLSIDLADRGANDVDLASSGDNEPIDDAPHVPRPGYDNAEPYDDPPPVPVPTVSFMPGSRHDPDAPPPYQIFCGDGPSGLLSLPEVDHVFVDVPYSQAVDDGNEADNTRDNSFGFDPMNADLMERTAQAIGMRCRRWCLLMTSDDEVHLWCAALERAGMIIYRIGHWVREGTKPQMDGTGPAQAVEYIIIAHSRFATQRWNGGGKRALWFAPIVHKENRRHPTQKPSQLLRQLFEDFTDPGDLIADVMAGSFESGVVAVSMGRRYVGWDIEQRYVDEAAPLFTMPLFDNSPLQASLFAEPRASTRAAQLRADMEREILRAIKARPGIKVSEIMQQVGTQDRSEVTRPLARMRKKMLVRQEGKTSSASYYPLTLAERQEIDEAARVAATATTPASPQPTADQGAPPL